MTPYSQKDPRWKDLKIGTTNLTMGSYGCYITSLAIITAVRPDLLLAYLNKNNAFDKTGALINQLAARLLQRSYKRSITPEGLCIAETDSFKAKGYPQHFFVWLNDKQLIIDPLDGLTKTNKYHIVSYRIFNNI